MKVGAPGPAPERPRLSDFVGEVLLLMVGGIHQSMQVANRVSDAARVTAVVMSGPQAGNWMPDMMVFNSKAVGQISAHVGGVVGVLVTQESGRNGAIGADPLAQQWQDYVQSWVDQHERDVSVGLAEVMRLFRDHEASRTDRTPPRGQQQPVNTGQVVPNNPPPLVPTYETSSGIPGTSPTSTVTTSMPVGSPASAGPTMPVGVPTSAGPAMPPLPSQALPQDDPPF